MRFRIPARRGRRYAGFTLIELMIAVVIVAVIAAVALPSYFGSVRKGRRSDGIAEVSRVQQAQERFRANNTTYSGDVSSSATGMGLTTGGTAATNYDTASGYYNIAVSGNTGTAYVVAMTAKSGRGQDKDTNCQCMRVSWSNGTPTYTAASMSGGTCGTYAATNAASCWRQ